MMQGKLLAGKELAYNRLLQQQQNLKKERDADEAQAQKLRNQVALLAEEEAEYHRIEKQAGSYEDVKQRLDGLREKKSDTLRLNAELGFATREIADLTARAEKQRAMIASLDADTAKKAELATKVRAGLGPEKSPKTGLNPRSVSGLPRSTGGPAPLLPSLNAIPKSGRRSPLTRQRSGMREPMAPARSAGRNSETISEVSRPSSAQKSGNLKARQSPTSNGRRNS